MHQGGDTVGTAAAPSVLIAFALACALAVAQSGLGYTVIIPGVRDVWTAERPAEGANALSAAPQQPSTTRRFA